MDGVDDTSGAKEEASLEHGVGEQVEHGRHVAQRADVVMAGGQFGADAEGHHHEGNLRDGGEGQHALDVALGTGHGGGIEGGEDAHPYHDAEDGVAADGAEPPRKVAPSVDSSTAVGSEVSVTKSKVLV